LQSFLAKGFKGSALSTGCGSNYKAGDRFALVDHSKRQLNIKPGPVEPEIYGGSGDGLSAQLSSLAFLTCQKPMSAYRNIGNGRAEVLNDRNGP